MIEVKDLCFAYGKKEVLKQINITIDPGKITVLIGPNGSGKSTLLRCMAGLHSPGNGEILYRGTDIRKYNHNRLPKHICFLPQMQTPLAHLRVWDLVAMGRSPHQYIGWILAAKDREKIAWALDCMDIVHLQHRFMEELSGGERQRAWLAMVLAQDTDVILLDEPVTFLDIKYQWGLLELIMRIRNELHRSLVLVLHDIDHALWVADTLLVLKDGAVHCSGPPEKIVTGELLYDVYGVHAQVCSVSDVQKRLVIVPQRAGTN